jgi:alpha-L-fucosidase
MKLSQLRICAKAATGRFAAFPLLPTALSEVAQKYESNWKSLDALPIPAWFDEAKFGIFIHWGVFSVPAWGPKEAMPNGIGKPCTIRSARRGSSTSKATAQTSFIRTFASRFTAELFEPDQWADIFVRSGDCLVVLTSKHHEGFCPWPSADSWNWNSVDVGPLATCAAT